MKQSLFTALAFAILTGCNSNEMPKVQMLGGFRILGIQSSQPEVNVSSLPATVQITPILSDLNSGGRTISIQGEACIDPGVSLGATPTCTGVPGAVTLSIPSVTPTATSSNSQLFGTPSLTGALPSFSVTIPTGITTGRSTVEQYNGVGYLISLKFTAGTDVITAYKRIVVSTRTSSNANPTISNILANGATLSTLPSAAVSLTSSVSGTTTYDYLDSFGTLKSRSKKFSVSYFATDGELKRAKSDPDTADTWTPPASAPTGRPTSIIAIVYDGLGGMSYLIRDL